MVRRLLLALILLGACSGDDEEPRSLVEECVEQTVDLYEKHDLPFTADEEDRPAICEDFLKENGITTRAQLLIHTRQLDKELDQLDP